MNWKVFKDCVKIRYYVLKAWGEPEGQRTIRENIKANIIGPVSIQISHFIQLTGHLKKIPTNGKLVYGQAFVFLEILECVVGLPIVDETRTFPSAANHKPLLMKLVQMQKPAWAGNSSTSEYGDREAAIPAWTVEDRRRPEDECVFWKSIVLWSAIKIDGL